MEKLRLLYREYILMDGLDYRMPQYLFYDYV